MEEKIKDVGICHENDLYQSYTKEEFLRILWKSLGENQDSTVGFSDRRRRET